MMSKITKGGILTSVIIVTTNAPVYFFFGVRWFGLSLSITAGIILLLLILRRQLARYEADMIIAGTFTPTIHELDSIIATLACSGEDHEPDAVRIQHLRQIRYRSNVSDIPTDTTPIKP